ncbi:hypothetical protein PISMIDRAFT_325532 [Pisolithus microcarpus 441]|uniref:Uncharacterized protein n=1 Tax=Pisolithus microcarpus 441 TaxID=765257 RepID=A0A0C9ZIK6_9AGAM|nr:hypothetical protein PISMIDRAFT_325532 [Pisolithus microcarpus 441]
MSVDSLLRSFPFGRSYRSPCVQRSLDTCTLWGAHIRYIYQFISVLLWVLRLNLGGITRSISIRWSFVSAVVSTSSKLAYGLTYDHRCLRKQTTRQMRLVGSLDLCLIQSPSPFSFRRCI